jgi:hypothetical protein
VTVRRFLSPLRWLVDWRTGTTLAASVVAGVLVFVVVDASRGRHDALEALKAQAAQSIDIRQAQSRRIDVLQEQVGELTAQILALRDQITAMGGTPVITDPARPDLSEDESPPRPDGTTTTTSSPRREPPPSHPSPTTTTTAPPPPTCTTVPVLGRCV